MPRSASISIPREEPLHAKEAAHDAHALGAHDLARVVVEEVVGPLAGHAAVVQGELQPVIELIEGEHRILHQPRDDAAHERVGLDREVQMGPESAGEGVGGKRRARLPDDVECAAHVRNVPLQKCPSLAPCLGPKEAHNEHQGPWFGPLRVHVPEERGYGERFGVGCHLGVLHNIDLEANHGKKEPPRPELGEGIPRPWRSVGRPRRLHPLRELDQVVDSAE
mmetsp:Transcript_17947/g.43979  ORF Transcript_17947/g.43979 Transcript_17947/m.43979 type:complete len:222 (-) Transcript_17947:308-973(-)